MKTYGQKCLLDPALSMTAITNKTCRLQHINFTDYFSILTTNALEN